MYLKKPLTLVLVFISIACSGQSIRFLNSFKGAITSAQSKDKLIFVDTYAPWCIPCKKMEKVFRDPQVAQYFNHTFVNVRIDMDNAKESKEIHKRYDVIFLPTLMILDKHGNVRYKVDREMGAKELLDIAQKIAEPEIYVVSKPNLSTQSKPVRKTIVKENPQPRTIPTKKVETVVQAPTPKKKEIIEGTVVEEKILHVFDANSKDLPPEILKEECYLRLQLMDGSHIEKAKEYLATQEDWSSLENMKFILDFIHTTDSKEFQHLLHNRRAYEESLGKKRVYHTLTYLVHNRLNRGFPRPTLDETKILLSYLHKESVDKLAYEHYMESIFDREKYVEYIQIGNEYISDINKDNDQVYYKLAVAYAEDKTGNYLRESLKSINKAIDINAQNYQYFDMQAYVYYKLGNRRKALKAAKKAKVLALKIGQETGSLDMLIEMIKEDL